MSDCKDDKYCTFFKEIKKFKELQDKQKQRGLNDYNMVNVVRKAHHEVGMHSNVIYSLINPHGLHYQDDLFLNLFIEHVIKPELELGANDFGKVISVKAEDATEKNKRIDFTIKSSNYYIGIEMKVDHGDSEYQLSDYHVDLKEKAKEENVLIYYLTKDGKDANLISTKIKDVKKNAEINHIKYKKVSFENHILKWIEACQKEVRNITNLNEALENYKDIVKKITGNYSSNVDALSDFLFEDNKLFEEAQRFHDENEKKKAELLGLEKEVFYHYRIAREKVVDNFFKLKLVKYLEENNCNVTLEYNDNPLLINITKDNNNIIFGFKTKEKNMGYYKINNEKNIETNYKYTYGSKSINAFYKNDGKEAKEYYLNLIPKGSQHDPI